MENRCVGRDGTPADSSHPDSDSAPKKEKRGGFICLREHAPVHRARPERGMSGPATFAHGRMDFCGLELEWLGQPVVLKDGRRNGRRRIFGQANCGQGNAGAVVLNRRARSPASAQSDRDEFRCRAPRASFACPIFPRLASSNGRKRPRPRGTWPRSVRAQRPKSLKSRIVSTELARWDDDSALSGNLARIRPRRACSVERMIRSLGT